MRCSKLKCNEKHLIQRKERAVCVWGECQLHFVRLDVMNQKRLVLKIRGRRRADNGKQWKAAEFSDANVMTDAVLGVHFKGYLLMTNCLTTENL